VIIPVKVRREKRRIYSKAAKSLRDMEKALAEMRDFLEQYQSYWSADEKEEFSVKFLLADLDYINVRASKEADESVDQMTRRFNHLSEEN
jgi:hypothetical protein